MIGAGYGVSQLNAIAFWLVPVFVVLMGSFFAPAVSVLGLVVYPPMSLQNPLNHFINGQFLWIWRWLCRAFPQSWAPSIS